jgi:hypothetical protein
MKDISNKIGRFRLTEIHEDTYTYSMADEDGNPFVLTQFIIDLEDNTYTPIERQEITFYPKSDVEISSLPFTEEELAYLNELGLEERE